MQEVKYRGSKGDGTWYIGDFITENREYNRTCDKAFILPRWDKLNCPISVDPKSVGQFTGLKDKNSTEIYHKDIIERNGIKYLVEFECGSFVLVRIDDTDMYEEFKECWNDDVYPLIQLYWHSEWQENHLPDVEVVGNTYENPELSEEVRHGKGES